MDTRTEQKLASGDTVEIDGITIHTPSCYDTSHNGALIVIDEGEIQDVECTVHVFDQELNQTYSDTYPAAPADCAIQPGGVYAVAATLKPDNRIHSFDVENGTRLWSRENHGSRPARTKRPQVTELAMNEDDTISVYTGGIEDYRLTSEGELHDAFEEERIHFKSLDDHEKQAIDFVKRYLNAEELQKNLKALVELDIRSEDAFIRTHLPSLVPEISGAIERHNVHHIDLADSSVPEAHQKLMSIGKRLLYEAGREDPSALEPILHVIETHLNNQPKQAIQSDLEQLKQIVPDWVQKLMNGEAGAGGCDLAPQGNGTVDTAPGGDRFSKSENGKGCGCVTLLLIALSTGVSVLIAGYFLPV